MAHITLSDEQAQLLKSATESVEVRDPEGHTLAFLKAFDPELVEIILEFRRRRAKPGPRTPPAQVQAHLRKLEEIRQREGMDRDKMLDLLRRMRAGEDVGVPRRWNGNRRRKTTWRTSGFKPVYSP